MGYNLYIGEAAADVDLADRYARVHVAARSHPDAPLGSTEDYTNYCWPSYTQWGAFCEKVGLYAVFYAGQRKSPEPWTGVSGVRYDGLLTSHPGCVAITEDHADAFAVALASWVPQPDEDGICWWTRRLEWLAWWSRWALDNCQHPSFYNS